MAEFDPAAFLDAITSVEDQLPEIKPKLTTFYYPATPEDTRKSGLSYSMEGGIQGGAGFSDVDLRKHTLEMFREGKSDFVAVAMRGKPTGEKFRTTVNGTPIIGKWVDTGGGLREGQADIATSNPELARSGVERDDGTEQQPAAQATPVQPINMGEFQQAIAEQPQDALLAGNVTGPALQQAGFDPQAFLDSIAEPTPSPTPTQTPVADFDPTAFLAEQTSRSEVLPEPIGEDEPGITQKVIRSGAKYATDMLPQSVEQAVQMTGVPTSLNPRQIAEFVAPPMRVSMGMGEQALHRIQQIREAEQTPAYSQQRFDAGIGTALDLAGMATIGGIGKVATRPRGKPSVTAKVASTREVPVPEAFQPKQTQRIPGEVVVAPANRYPDGSFFSGSNHGVIAEKHGAVTNPDDAGFVTSSNRYLTPKEAHEQFGVAVSEDLGELEPPTTPAQRPEPQLAEPLQFSVDMPTDVFGTEHTPVANYIIGSGGITSKSTAKRLGLYDKTPALWENAPRLSHPTHGKIYPSTKVAVLDKSGQPTGKFRSIGVKGETPENMARDLYRKGLIPDEYVDTMWNELDKESQSARNTLKSQRGEATDIAKGMKEKAEQTAAFNQAEQAAWKGGEPAIPVRDLQVGDTVEIGGEKFKVTDIDPDTFDVTLEDGRKFGVQTVSDQTVIYGEHEPITPKQPSSVKTPSAAAQQIRTAVDSYDFKEQHAGVSELADDIEQIENLPKPLSKALQEYRDAVEEDRTLYGERSGEPEIYGDRLYKLATEHAAPETPTEPPAAPPPVPPAPPTLPPAGAPPPPPIQPPETPQQLLSRKQIAQSITAKDGSVYTFADYDARQRVNPLRQDFGWKIAKPNWSLQRLKTMNLKANRDMDAATFIEEAQGNPVALEAMADLVHSSKNKKLAGRYGPIVDYAIANFDRLSRASGRYRKLMSDQLAEDHAAGITYGEQQGYVTHVLKNEPESTLMSFFTGGSSGGGLSRYFTKHREFNSLAEAIHEGIEPASVNLADLAQHRVAASRRLILQKAMFNELREMAGPDGRPAVAQQGKTGPPFGYDQIRANGIDIAVHPDYAPIFKALYGDSAFRRTPRGRALMRTVGIQKAYTLAADTFHGFRGIQKGLFYGGKGSRLGYNRGTTLYELSDSALDTAVSRGEVTRAQADWAKNARPALESMMKEGLNVSRYADNLVQQLHVQFPGTKGLNNWIFQRVFRGSMMQAAHANFIRNMDRFGPGSGKGALTEAQIAQKTAREMNEVFGNLMSQGLFKDKTVRDALNVTFLAPQWVESQVRAEFRGYGQAAKVIPDAFKGKFRVGTVAQGQATAVAAFLLGNQIINYATTGHSTFENPEGHKLAAYVPIGRGVYIDPLALSAEYVSRFMEVMDRQGEKGSIPTVLSEIAQGKLSNIGRTTKTLATGRDWRGRRLHGKDLYLGAASELIPLPIASSAVVQRDSTSDYGLAFGVEGERIVQQLLQSAGLRARIERKSKSPAGFYLGQ